ncbi:hypothetical protein SK128_005273 [Halocaridina rubra]|uniref:Tafazzin family protein n=1 Tax=Halocaridina rubra TaxID=373956 RepID=A0AAN8XLK5_HALRR
MTGVMDIHKVNIEKEPMKTTGNKNNMTLALKYGWPFPDMTNPPLVYRLKTAIIVPLVGTFSKIILNCCNTVYCHNVNRLREAVASRPKGVPLITVSNHYSCLDDPALWGVLRCRDLLNYKKMRWSPAAHDIAFTQRIHSWFFSAGRCVPIIRGIGVYQRAMDFLLERLKEGDWVHIFPEGKVNMNRERIRFKWGIGRLVYESPVCPIVLPFYHIGMETVLPNRAPYIPRIGKKVTVLVGEPMDFKELVEEMKAKEEDPTTARKLITDRIQEEIWRLREKAEELHEGMLYTKGKEVAY